MKAKLLKLAISLLVFTAVLFSAVLLTAYLQRDMRLKLVCSPFTERKGSYVRYCIPNPFRDKKPEQIAENLMLSLKNEQIDMVLPYLRSGSKEPEKDVGREKNLIVSSWRNINREIENDGRYRLSYVYKQKDFDDEIPIGFYFVKSQDTWVLDEIVAFW